MRARRGSRLARIRAALQRSAQRLGVEFDTFATARLTSACHLRTTVDAAVAPTSRLSDELGVQNPRKFARDVDTNTLTHMQHSKTDTWRLTVQSVNGAVGTTNVRQTISDEHFANFALNDEQVFRSARDNRSYLRLPNDKIFRGRHGVMRGVELSWDSHECFVAQTAVLLATTGALLQFVQRYLMRNVKRSARRERTPGRPYGVAPATRAVEGRAQLGQDDAG